jgi:cyclohexa-1,5-dienecarbonyl-CoA hydratase
VKLRSELLDDETLLQLTLDAPRGNVLDVALMTELRGALAAHRENRGLRMVVLRATGADFSFGVSIPEHRREVVAETLATFHALVRDVASFPVPVAALVQGRCLGGAFELALCCHFVVATSGAIFACPEIRLGVIPPVLAVVGPWRLGGALAERMLLTGDPMDATEALRAGLVADILESNAAFLEWYRRRLRPLSAHALRQGVAVTRRASGLLDQLGAPLEAAEQHYLQHVATSHDGNEGLDAFLAKRDPVWTDN